MSGCPGDPNDPEAGRLDGDSDDPECVEAEDHDDFAWIEANILEPSCVSAPGCHDGSSAIEDLDLSGGGAFDALVNGGSLQQVGMAFVEPGVPSESYLMLKLGDYDQGLLLERSMPYGIDRICWQKRDAIARWIEAGAQP